MPAYTPITASLHDFGGQGLMGARLIIEPKGWDTPDADGTAQIYLPDVRTVVFVDDTPQTFQLEDCAVRRKEVGFNVTARFFDLSKGIERSVSLGLIVPQGTEEVALRTLLGAEDHPPSTQIDALAAALAAKAAAQAAAAQAALERAAAEAARDVAVLYEGFWVNDVAELFSNPALTYANVPVGKYIRDRKRGFSWRVLPTLDVTPDIIVPGTELRLEVQPMGGALWPEAFGASPLANSLENAAAIQAAVNSGSRREFYVIEFGAGLFKYKNVYLFYHATLNPGFTTNTSPLTEHGRFMFRGAGMVSVSNLRQLDFGRGTALRGHLVVSSVALGHGTAPYPARNFGAQEISFVGVEAGRWAVEAASCPFAYLQRVAITHVDLDGEGLLMKSAWGALLESCEIIGRGAGATGTGLTMGTDISAGQFFAVDTIIDGWGRNSDWEGGTWDVVGFIRCTFQASNDVDLYMSAGIIRDLVFDRCHFEGAEGFSGGIIAGPAAIGILTVSGGYCIAGQTNGNARYGNTLFDLDVVGRVKVDGFTLMRPAQTFMHIASLQNGKRAGAVKNLNVVHDFVNELPAQITLFTGILPNLDGLAPGLGGGMTNPTGKIRLFDPAGTWPAQFVDPNTATEAAANVSVGRVLVFELAGGTTNVSALAAHTHIAVCTANSSLLVPNSAAATEGREMRFVNHWSSTANLTVKDSSSNNLALLAPGESITIVNAARAVVDAQAAGGWFGF